MSEQRCTPGRLVRLRFRNRKTGKVHVYGTVYPLRWRKSEVLARARKFHPEDTAVIIEWPMLGWDHIWVSGAYSAPSSPSTGEGEQEVRES